MIDYILRFLAIGIGAGALIGLPVLLLTTFIQRLLKGYFYGWRHFSYAAVIVIILSGNVAAPSIEALPPAPDTPGLLPFAGIILFPFGISVLVTELIYIVVHRYYRKRHKPTKYLPKSVDTTRYQVRAKRKIGLPRSHYWVLISDEHDRPVLQSNRLEMREREYAGVLKGGLFLYEPHDKSHPKLKLVVTNVGEDSSVTVDIIDCSRDERVASIRHAGTTKFNHWSNWAHLAREGGLVGNFHYSSPWFLYHCDINVGHKLVGLVREKVDWRRCRLPMLSEVANDQLDERIALGFVGLMVALRERQGGYAYAPPR